MSLDEAVLALARCAYLLCWRLHQLGSDTLDLRRPSTLCFSGSLQRLVRRPCEGAWEGTLSAFASTKLWCGEQDLHQLSFLLTATLSDTAVSLI